MASASTTPLGLSLTNISAIFLDAIARIFTATMEHCSGAASDIGSINDTRGSTSVFSSTLHAQQQVADGCDEDDVENEDETDEDDEGVATKDEIESLEFKYLSTLSKSDRIAFHSSPSTLSNELQDLINRKIKN